MKKRNLLALLMAVAMTLSLAACGGSSNGGAASSGSAAGSGSAEPTVDLNIVSIPKLIGVAWFDRMITGGDEWVAANGGKFYQSGPSTADAALQLQSV